MPRLVAALVLCVGLCSAQLHSHDHSAWDPVDDPKLDLGPSATLTTHNDTIRVLIDTEFNFLVIKDLHKYTCFLIALTPADVTADDIIKKIDERGTAILETDFRPAAQTPRHDVKRQFGPRVAHFCLHNPTFLLAKAADTVPTQAPLG